MANNEHIAVKADPADPEDFDVCEAGLAQALAERRERRMRGPQRAAVKEQVTVRPDHDVLAWLRAGGPGWQGRMNAALRSVAGL